MAKSDILSCVSSSRKIRIYVTTTLIASVMTLVLIVFNVSVTEGAPLVILVVFLLLYCISLAVTLIALMTAISVKDRFDKSRRRDNMSDRRSIASMRRPYYIASTVAFLPVALLAMSSLGRLELRDVVLICLVVGMAVFYIYKQA